jgi:hypothetical protein
MSYSPRRHVPYGTRVEEAAALANGIPRVSPRAVKVQHLSTHFQLEGATPSSYDTSLGRTQAGAHAGAPPSNREPSSSLAPAGVAVRFDDTNVRAMLGGSKASPVAPPKDVYRPEIRVMT